jgi:hypothetical protein
MSLLNAILEGASLPRRLLWQGAHSLLGTPETPEDAVSALGMDPEGFGGKLAGFGLSMATDPLTYGGALLGALRAGRGASLAGEAGEAAGSPGWLQAVRKTGNPKIDALASQAPAKIAGATGVAPEEIKSGIMGSLREMMKPVSPGVETLMPLRRQFEMITNPEEIASNPLLKRAGEKGAFNPKLMFGYASGRGTPGFANTLRHENLHGLVEAAARSGDTEDLPALMRWPAQQYQKAVDFGGGGLGAQITDGPRYGLATLLDEIQAHTLSEKGLVNQLGGLRNFLFDPHLNKEYAARIKDYSPALANLYGNLHKVPQAGAGALGLGTLGYLGGQTKRDENTT